MCIIASREVILVHHFFKNLAFIVNVVCSTSTHHDKLQVFELDEVAQLLEMGELKTSKGKKSK